MEFVDSGWITAAGASVLTFAIALAAVVFWKVKGVSRSVRGLIYGLTLVVGVIAMSLFFLEKRSATTIAGAVGQTLDQCRQTLDTVDGLVRAKLLVADNVQGARNVAQEIKNELDRSTCKRAQ